MVKKWRNCKLLMTDKGNSDNGHVPISFKIHYRLDDDLFLLLIPLLVLLFEGFGRTEGFKGLACL
jgi:hypothetical protein